METIGDYHHTNVQMHMFAVMSLEVEKAERGQFAVASLKLKYLKIGLPKRKVVFQPSICKGLC